MSAHRVVLPVLLATLMAIAFVLAPSRPVPVAASPDMGIIAYVRPSTRDIRLISPDGSGDRVLWNAPHPATQSPAHDLSWRPDGRELAFTSEHEETCSWYQSDVYVVGYTGSGYRRVTNAPACAVLASLPKGSVTVDVTNYSVGQVQVYVQGAPGITLPFHSGTVTFENVADLGPGVEQPAVGIDGEYRTLANPPLADVQPGATVSGGELIITWYSGIDALGPGKLSWKADGSALAFGMRTFASIRQIPAAPPYGSIGEELPVVENASPNLVAWGPTAATKDQYLYFSKDNPIFDDIDGIYLNTLGDQTGGAKLVAISAFYKAEKVYDLEWLPDGSGFLFTKSYINLGSFSDIFEYSFATKSVTMLTPSLEDDNAMGGARGLSISPDGQQVVFERAVYPFDTPSSVWIINRNGTGLHKLADDAGRPAWGKVPPPLAPGIYLPMVIR